jgi:hypothetical protein
MDNLDLTRPAFVFWMRKSKVGRPGGVTRFERLEDAVNCVMQHAFAPTDPVAWIKTMSRHLDMNQIRNIARHSGLVSYLSKTEERLNVSVEDEAFGSGPHLYSTSALAEGEPELAEVSAGSTSD